MILDTKEVTKRFGGLTAVNQVSMQVEEGQIYGLIGPNGAGKTTFLNSIAGKFPPTNGKVYFRGKETTGNSADVMCKKGLARTFQIPRPFPKLTVLENVKVGAVFGPNGPRRKSAEQRAREALDFVDFTLPIDTPAQQLNAVQLKRIDLARALACEPKLLLLDELASGLTPGELDSIMELILEIRDNGVTIIAIEHIMRVIKGICDEVMVINYGTTIAEGTPDEVLNNPVVIEAYLGEEEVPNARN
ncbi:MAG: ABC transporter ATP-binding protein [Anaerolineales bacterium]|nr:ABC transporter ATP-binding protein [Anaerolineales bacterium]